MDFWVTKTSNNPDPGQFNAGDLSPEQERVLPIVSDEIVLSLEQATPLLQGVEIPVLAAQRIYHRSDLRELAIQYPCHLRAPIQGGMGITVANRIDAIAACQTLFSRKVNGMFPEYLLVEVDYSLERQLSLAIWFDEQSEGVTLWGSNHCNLGTSLRQDDDLGIQKICLPGNLQLQDGLLLASKLGLEKVEAQGLAHLLEKLYQLMTWTGVKRCCLDSLALGKQGEVMALSGEFIFYGDSPLKRQALAAMQSGTMIHSAILSHGLLAEGARARRLAPQANIASQQSVESQANGLKPSQNLFAPPPVVRLGEGNIAVLSNDFKRTMDTLERFQLQGGSVAAFVNLQAGGGIETQAAVPEVQDAGRLPRMAWTDGALVETIAQETQMGQTARLDARDTSSELDAFSLKRQLCQALHALDRLREIRVILVNWRSSQLPCRILADALVEYQGQLAHQARRSAQPLSLVVRLAGEGAAAGYQRLMGEEIETAEDLDGAIARSMGLARMGRGF